MGDACVEEGLRFGATLLLPCAMLHAHIIRDVWLQSPVLFLDWKRCQAFREHGAMALESKAVDFPFLYFLQTPPCISDIEQIKGYLNAEHDHQSQSPPCHANMIYSKPKMR